MSAIFTVGVKESAITTVHSRGIQTAKGFLTVLHIKNTKSQTVIVSNTLQHFNSKAFTYSNKQFSAKKIESIGIQPQNYFLNDIILRNDPPTPTRLLNASMQVNAGSKLNRLDSEIAKMGNCNAIDQCESFSVISKDCTKREKHLFTNFIQKTKKLNVDKQQELVSRLKQEIETINKSVIGKNANKDIKEELSKISAELEINTEVPKQANTPSVGDIYYRFFRLLERLINQSDHEANQLYSTIKKRSDDYDRLNDLYGKLLAEGKDVDWSKNEEMKKLVEEAKRIGITVPNGKNPYQWNEDQKKSFLESIRNKKDSLDKINQLEKTDFQRFMQASIQCHEWRSNVLKWLGKVTDSVIANFRGH